MIAAGCVIGTTSVAQSAHAQGTMSRVATLPALSRTGMEDRTLAAVLHASNVGEAQIARMALRRAARANVRKFAELMLRDHIATDEALLAAQGRTPRWALTRETLAGATVDTDSTGHMAHTGSIGTTGSAGYAGTGVAAAAAATATGSSAASSDTANVSGTGTMATSGSIGTTGSAGYANAGSPIGMSGAAGSGSTAITSSTSAASDIDHATRAMATGLEAAQDTAFDRAYIDSQVSLHKWMLQSLDDTLIPAATDAALRSTLQQLRARVAEHLGMAQVLQGNITSHDH